MRGRNASGLAEACWVPVAPGLTPHGLRHTYKTLMQELSTPPPLRDERMGHEDGSIQARYSHVTSERRQRLMDGLTAVWETALAARREMSPGSPVTALDRLLRRGRKPSHGAHPNKIVSQISPSWAPKQDQGRLSVSENRP
jgi:hypothetical protein